VRQQGLRRRAGAPETNTPAVPFLRHSVFHARAPIISSFVSSPVASLPCAPSPPLRKVLASGVNMIQHGATGPAVQVHLSLRKNVLYWSGGRPVNGRRELPIPDIMFIDIGKNTAGFVSGHSAKQVRRQSKSRPLDDGWCTVNFLVDGDVFFPSSPLTRLDGFRLVLRLWFALLWVCCVAGGPRPLLLARHLGPVARPGGDLKNGARGHGAGLLHAHGHHRGRRERLKAISVACARALPSSLLAAL